VSIRLIKSQNEKWRKSIYKFYMLNLRCTFLIYFKLNKIVFGIKN